MTLSPLVVALALTTIASFAVAQDDGVALYLAHCARCHGETGHGDGPESAAQERPPRSFAAGAFSFGDTPTALERTIANGIPGSPMAAFGEALSEGEITAIAEHLITLMPARRVVGAGEAEMIFGDDGRALMARGHLGALVSGGPAFPRGLVLGTPNHPWPGMHGAIEIPLSEGHGMTSVYDAEDLRLLQVRIGGFVRRTDWTGRGGTPLELLGEPQWTAPRGDPAAEWALEVDGKLQPLRAELRETRLVNGNGTGTFALHSELIDEAGRVHAEVTEWMRLTGEENEVRTGPSTYYLLMMRSLEIKRHSEATFVRRFELSPDQTVAYAGSSKEGLLGGPCHPQRPRSTSIATRGDELHGEVLTVYGTGAVGLRSELTAEGFTGPLEFSFPPSDPSCDRDEPIGLLIILVAGQFDDTDLDERRQFWATYINPRATDEDK